MTKRTNFDRAGLLAMLEAGGLDTSDLGKWGNPISELTAAELRALVDAGFLKIRDFTGVCLDFAYALGVMEKTGATAFGQFDLDRSRFHLDIEGFELRSKDAKTQVEFLRMTRGAEEDFDIKGGGIGVRWEND